MGWTGGQEGDDDGGGLFMETTANTDLTATYPGGD